MSTNDPKWRKVLLSGSNAHVAALTASAIVNTGGDAQSPGIEEKVLVYNTSSGAIYYTGSYGQGGSGAGNPSGNDGNIQFNDNGDFGGSDNFMFDSTQNASLLVDGPITASIVSASGAISGSSIDANTIVARNTDDSATIALKDADGNNVAQLTRVGSTTNAHKGKFVLRDNSQATVILTAGTDANFISNTSNDAQFGINDIYPSESLSVYGNVSASGNFSFGAPSTIQSSSAGDISLEIRNPAQSNTTSTSTLAFGHIASGNGGKIVSVRETNYAGSSANANSALVFHTAVANINTERLRISSLGHITASGNITSSGKIFGSTSLSSSHANNNVVLVNTVTGELYHTGSYGSGGSGGGIVTAINNNTNDNVLTAMGTNELNGEAALTFNTSNGLRVAGNAFLGYLQNGSFGGNAAATSYKAGQFLESSELRTYVTPQKPSQRMALLGVAIDRDGKVISNVNYIRFTSSIFYDPTTGGGGGHDPDQDDGTFGTNGRIQVADRNKKTGITLSGNPGIYFFNNNASASVSGSFSFDSASAHIKFDTGSSGVQFLTGETTQTLTQTLFLSQSGGNATVGVGTTTPESIFDIQEVANNSTGTRILLKSARSSTEGAQVGDAAGSIFFAIDSASFANVFDTGSVAEITTEVTALLNTGNSLPDVAGNIQLKSSPPHNESLNTVATVGHFPNSYFNPQTGTVDQSAALLVSGALLVDPYLAAAQGQAVALRVKNVKDASGLGFRSDFNDVFVITGSNAVLNSGSLVVGSGSVFLAASTADSTTHYGAGGLEFVNFRGQGPIKLGQVSSTGMGGATQLDFYTGDTQRTRLDGSGNFGIGTGTRTLSKKLEVEGQISASGEVSANTIVVGSTITHIGDSNTKITFSDDDINLTIAGKTAIDLTFDGTGGGDTREITFNESHEDIDVRIEGDTDTDLFFTNAGTDRVGIGTNSPSSKLEVDGDITSTHITASGNISSSGAITASAFTGDGSGLTGVGTVDTTGTPADNQIAVFTDSDTIEGTSKLTFSNNDLLIHSSNVDNSGVEIYGGVVGAAHPYISPVGSHTTIKFGDGTTGHIFDLQNNKIGFDADSTNTYIQADTSNPENLEIHADGNIELRADDELQIFSDVDITGNITASGNISASGDIAGNTITVAGTDFINLHSTGYRVNSGAGPLNLFGNITASSNISASGDLEFENRLFDESHDTLGSNGAIGDIVKFGNSSTVAGGLYYLNSSGGWSLALASAAATSTGSLAVALGSNSTTDGMCLRGFINPFTDPGASVGSPVYISDAASGRIIGTAPSSTGDVVRIVGYQYGTDLIYFNPSNDFIIHA